MCPVAGLDQVQSSASGPGTVQGANQVNHINYRGCMDFRYPQLWQNLDDINALAGDPPCLSLTRIYVPHHLDDINALAGDPPVCL